MQGRAWAGLEQDSDGPRVTVSMDPHGRRRDVSGMLRRAWYATRVRPPGAAWAPGWTRVCRRARRTMLAKMFSYTPIGIDAVEVEVDVSADVRGDVRGGHSGSWTSDRQSG
jgi:hypothetical protein